MATAAAAEATAPAADPAAAAASTADGARKPPVFEIPDFDVGPGVDIGQPSSMQQMLIALGDMRRRNSPVAQTTAAVCGARKPAKGAYHLRVLKLQIERKMIDVHASDEKRRQWAAEVGVCADMLDKLDAVTSTQLAIELLANTKGVHEMRNARGISARESARLVERAFGYKMFELTKAQPAAAAAAPVTAPSPASPPSPIDTDGDAL